MTKVLIVEDDEELGAQIVGHLIKAGFEARWVKDGDLALKESLSDVSLVILDLMLPGTYGLDVLKHYRSQTDVPVLILSALNETRDKVRGLELGADDFVTKPFWPEELVARIKARIRRPVIKRGELLVVGPFQIDQAEHTAKVGGVDLDLTPVEFELLLSLMERPQSAVSRAQLVDRALDPDRQGTERTIDVHMSRLRKKLGEEGKRIETVWGVGYRLSTADAG